MAKTKSRTKTTLANAFSADVNRGESPLFRATTMELFSRYQESTGPYWQGFGTHYITLDPFNPVEVHLSIFVKEIAKPDTYTLGEDEKDVWAAYAVTRRDGNVEAYLSISGEVTLEAIPPPGKRRLKGTLSGTLSFTGKYQDKEVNVTNGHFNLTKNIVRVL
ncbi:hypothetical protein NZ35_25355 [Pseudomonas chlororaphis]|uniref:Uncharacterized protein n=1 Tax=Pseudomonas chlororaphis TaxID=587753 RepID=A0A0A6D3K6_9PSED|nr:hypothetical protein NZ35_25355 [Pseudomonas chlororaphis]